MIASVLMAVAAMLAGLGLIAQPIAVNAKTARVRAGWGLTQVVVAARELSGGTTLRPEDLSLREEPKQLITPSYSTDAQALVGKTLVMPMARGTPIPFGLLADQRTGCTEPRP